jgi:D-alanine--poly(phosphoribitol) ligase subunit 1
MKYSFEQKDFIELLIEPNKLAIIGEDRSLTWAEFHLEVNAFCVFLEENNFVNSLNPVIIYGHKQVEMIVSIYACIKLGITYIPVDLVYPINRILAIKNIAKVDLILNCTGQQLKIDNTTEIIFTNGSFSFSQKNPHECMALKKSDPLVYIIFTSGSTGEPKGVQISTEAILSFSKWMTEDFGFTAADVFVNVALFSFDLSVYELITFAALGASLVLNSNETLEKPEAFLSRMDKFKGSIWVSTPSFAFVYSRMESKVIDKNVRCFLFCGEVLTSVLAKTLKENYKNALVYNTYGPTEATVATTLVEITNSIIDKYNPLPVGFPKPDCKIRIEEEEIVIIGKNVSVGYLNRPDLNEEKFSMHENERSFKTGDKGYFLDGMLFCKGRNDDQVKLHGYRIELNEITSKMDAIAYIVKSETIALRRNGEVKKIVSLIVLSDEQLFDVKKDLNNKLASLLPAYMIPSDFLIIEKIPLNQNGKADKLALEKMYLDRNK